VAMKMALSKEIQSNEQGRNPGNGSAHVSTLRIKAVGDVALNGAYHQLVDQGRIGSVTTALARLLSGADLVIGNLEGPLTTHPSLGPPSRFCLHGSPAYARELRASGFHVLSLANNHMLDNGWAGAEETLFHLDEAGIRYVGLGRNLEEARKPLCLTVRGVRVAILAYCDVSVLAPLYAGDDRPGVAPAHRSYILEDIGRASCENRVVIVCIHWGQEHVRYPSPKHRTLAREMIAAGASMIIGHHPHVLQGVESVGRGAVAYSLGNFTFSEQDWFGINEQGESFSLPYRINEASRGTAVWCVCFDECGVVVREELSPAYLGRDLLPIANSLEEAGLEIQHNRKILQRPGYALFWSFCMFVSRLNAIVDQFGGIQEIRKRLRRLRPRHIQDLRRILVREWQQFRGVNK
jgi:hypothetical protein